MNAQRSTPGDRKTVWNHTFLWTSKHQTAEQLAPLRDKADDLGVKVVQCLRSLGPPRRRDLYEALKTNCENDKTLQDFWAEIHSVPKWVDWPQIERGQKFLYRYLAPNLVGLALQGFLGGTATIAGGTEVLVRTGGFSVNVLERRFLETFLWLLQVTTSLHSIQPGGEGFASTVRVRLLHATVRYRILGLMDQDPSYFDQAKYGTPVNLRDAIHATCIFCCMPLFRQLPAIGIQPSADEIADFVALFRYIAYLMGTPHESFASVERAKATMESVMLCEPEPTEASKAIAMNFIATIQDYPGINISRAFIETGCRALSGDELADTMGFSRPSIFSRIAFRGCCTLLVVMSTLQQWIPAFDRLMIQKSKQLVGSIMTLQGEKFEYKHVPRLDKFTQREDKKRCSPSRFRPVETIGFIVVAGQVSIR
ncbi:hypothetical protein N7476_005076 [Penicillium atrosanguineum]|uniref:ER-bound oxygenase mpaB/mpaB'/Rubber oxygenase catalytic domain-containing protein n=1 Tax=Penicillium atrosanguineum TaxID=1132637 RepID=A0A9W9U669_9EURO|nr:hypothetical protein N7476_005076 [Penicillium atrosanguineum]